MSAKCQNIIRMVNMLVNEKGGDKILSTEFMDGTVEFFSEILTIFINSGAFCSLFKEGCYTYFTCYYPAKFSLVSSPDIYSFFVQSK